MKRQSDQLGFNCDLLLMLFLGVNLLLKINQCYHAMKCNHVKSTLFSLLLNNQKIVSGEYSAILCKHLYV